MSGNDEPDLKCAIPGASAEASTAVIRCATLTPVPPLPGARPATMMCGFLGSDVDAMWSGYRILRMLCR
eukprot:1759228-Rhodomonas_salina.1